MRLRMLLETDEDLSTLLSRKKLKSESNESIVVAVLNPRFFCAIEDCCIYDERVLAEELSRLFNFHFCSDGDGNSTIPDKDGESELDDILLHNSIVITWTLKLI